MKRDPELERDLDDEIRFHVEMRTKANLAAGMDPQEARMDAERRFGDQAPVRRAGRKHLRKQGKGAEWIGGRSGLKKGAPALTTRVLDALPSLPQDVAFGVRMLIRRPVITIAAVLSLGLGVGANTANFSIVYGILFRELPFEEAGGLTFVDAWNPERGDGDAPVTWADLGALRSSGMFEAVEGFDFSSFTITGGDRPERIAGAHVTPGLFPMLGVAPRLGRFFHPEEGLEAGSEGVALLSDGLWRSRFAADPGILGRTLRVDGREVTIVGVMAPGFRFPERQDLWLPLGAVDPTDHTERRIIGVARLREGAGFAAAGDVASRWSSEAATRFPDTHGGWTLRAQPFRHGFVAPGARQFMAILMASVGFVLLLACANVANLLLARASDRKEELSVRSSLGATRLRLARQVLIESLVLGAVGGLLGVLVAKIWLDFFARAIPEEMAFWIDMSMDRTILLYTLAISIFTGLLFGLLPALQASRAGLAETIRSGSRSILGGGGRARGTLVIVEVGLAMVLLTSATFMVRSFLALQQADPGFDDTPLLSLRIIQTGETYEDPAARGQYFREVSERLGSLPGSVSAAATSAIPADDGGSGIRILPEGTPEDEALFASAILSTHAFFETLGLDLSSGRTFTPTEELDPEADVAILGERLAQRLWPGESPLGRIVNILGTGAFRVIGLAPDIQYEEFGEDLEGARLQIHLPYGVGAYGRMSILVRAAGDPSPLVATVRETLADIDPSLAPFDILTMRERRAYTTWEQILFGKSFAIFGAIALLLAVCGIYGVISNAVARQTREIGIRIALGALPGKVQGRVVGSALALAGTGATLGLIASLAFARGLRGIVFGVDPLDPLVFAGAAGILLLTAAVAGWLPALRAARIDPTEALRAE